MENVKEILRDNLINFRKANKLTQQDLSEKINYSDKAISRWENGDVVPDIETLNVLSEVYNIKISQFFEKASSIEVKKRAKIAISNKMAVASLAVVCVWFVATIIFIYQNLISDKNLWLVFVWAVPVSFVVSIIFNSRWGNKKIGYYLSSFLVWSLLASIYLQCLASNIYLIFILGVPIQIAIILSIYINKKN